jgi:hypothetical protein
LLNDIWSGVAESNSLDLPTVFFLPATLELKSPEEARLQRAHSRHARKAASAIFQKKRGNHCYVVAPIGISSSAKRSTKL